MRLIVSAISSRRDCNTGESWPSPTESERAEAEGVSLLHLVGEEFEAYLKCGRLEYGFLRVKCDA